MTTFDDGLIHITVPGRPDDPRMPLPDIPGVVVHRVPELHPDDMTVVDGIPVTSVARTLLDCGEEMDKAELCAMFAQARRRGLLDMRAVEASYARLEWRPSRRDGPGGDGRVQRVTRRALARPKARDGPF